MKKVLFSTLLGIYCNSGLLAQTTSPLPYCYAGFDFLGGDPVGSDWINSVQLGTLNNISNAECPAPHYIFYNNLAAPNLAKGASYTLNLNFNIGGGVGYAAWIDYNHNDVFDSTELIAGIKASSGIALGASVPIVATVTIPSTALSGNTRMRIRMTEDDTYHGTHIGAYELACDSMNTTSYGGETEDYTVNILPGTGIEELSSNTHFSLYPNPANTFLKIEVDNTGPLAYTIFDITGIQVLKGETSKMGNIDVSTLNSGIYAVEIANQGQLIGYEKFIKQ